MRKKKTGLTEKQIRKSNITQMSVVATMVYNIVMGDGYGVPGIQPYLDRRKGSPVEMHYVPGVMLTPKSFMDLFGDDTDYEYLTDSDGDMSVLTEMNGVTFFALINGLDEIVDGRLA